MKIVILAQEEPVYFGPFFNRLIKALGNDVALVALAGSRGAGNHPKSFKEKLENLYLLWLLLEPAGFVKSLAINLGQKFLQITGLTGSLLDVRSIEGAAKRLDIPVTQISNANSDDFLKELTKLAPDLIINQTELLLKEPILSIPKIGILNRHGSLLPHFRGRLASFWSHFNQPPEYGVTIHLVNEKIDSGPIIVQKRLEINPASSYSEVLEKVFDESFELMLDAINQISDAAFTPSINHYQGTPLYKFPTLAKVEEYRKILKQRRQV